MFDILVFLFENFFAADPQPDRDSLERELTAAGFATDEIDQAFDWLKGLDNLTQYPYPESLADSVSVRCYSEMEEKKLAPEGRGFLAFLESSGVINPIQREWIIDRALALPDSVVSVEEVKWIVLLVLWKQGRMDETLFLEDLLLDASEVSYH